MGGSRNKTPQRKDSGGTTADSAASPSNNDETPLAENVAYQDALEDVHTRFILNLPDSELQTADRIFFQLEQAWWFYEDWICDPHPEQNLPRFSTLKPFAQQLFAFSPLLPDPSKFSSMWQQFSLYKRKISNYGCILLSPDYTKVVLCQLWNSKTYTFPAGKINQGEDGLSAAARETYEETGFDPLCQFGLTSEMSDKTWKPLREQDAISFEDDNGKRRTAYICHGVPEDFPFEPVARKEVSVVEWHGLDNVPKKSYAVLPFLKQLRRWIAKDSKKKAAAKQAKRSKTPQERNKTPSKSKGTPKRDRSRGKASRSQSRDKVRVDDDVVVCGLAQAGDISGWSEEDMFKANERILGRKVEYDGNPHVFSEQGFAGKDPHAFHIVGGDFLNSIGGVRKLAPAPEKSKLQPLFRKETDSAEQGELQPFFSDEGATPWGEVVEEAKDACLPRALDMASFSAPGAPAALLGTPAIAPGDSNSIFMTDAQITAKSQAEKTGAKLSMSEWKENLERQYQADMEYIRQWVANLPRGRPTKRFGEFKLDADAIMANLPPGLLDGCTTTARVQN